MHVVSDAGVFAGGTRLSNPVLVSLLWVPA